MASPPSQRLILLAEDQVMVRNLIRMILQSEGYRVLAAADGNEALELFRAHAETITIFSGLQAIPHSPRQLRHVRQAAGGAASATAGIVRTAVRPALWHR